MAVFTTTNGTSFPHSTFHDLPFHSFPHSFLSTLLSFCNPQHGYFPLYRQRIARKLLIRSPVSCLFPPPSAFSSIFDRRKFGIPVAVVTTPGVFSCLVELQPGAADNIYDVRLGRDWFSYCTTTVPHAQILLSDDRCLTFSSSCYRRAIYF
jgi:hypothetical protein